MFWGTSLLLEYLEMSNGLEKIYSMQRMVAVFDTGMNDAITPDLAEKLEKAGIQAAIIEAGAFGLEIADHNVDVGRVREGADTFLELQVTLVEGTLEQALQIVDMMVKQMRFAGHQENVTVAGLFGYVKTDSMVKFEGKL